jgi:uncharacterized protein YxeA
MLKIFNLFIGYKNVLIYIVVLSLVVAYSVFIWRTAVSSTTADYIRKDNETLTAQIAKTKEKQELADKLGKELATIKAKRQEKQKVITREVTIEVEKPVYRECLTTDDGVRLIEQAIDSGNIASVK